VIQVGVGEQGVLDLDLLGHREGAPDRSRVDQHPIIDKKRRRPLSRALTAEGPEDPNLH
jgi:hypothetical protein